MSTKSAIAPVAINIADFNSWPYRLTVSETASIIRRSRRSLYDLIEAGKFPPADPGPTWHRDVVKRYVDGQIRQFEKPTRSTLRRIG